MSLATPTALGNVTSLGTTSLSLTNLTLSGTDRILMVAVATGLKTGSTVVSSITFAGVALTQLGGYFGFTTDGFWLSYWYLINPSTAANQTLAVTQSTNTYMAISAMYTTGADQTTPFTTPVTVDQNSSPATLINTSNKDGSMQVGLIGGANDSLTVSSGGISRQALWAGYYLMFDSNATVANGVSNTLTFAFASGGSGLAAMLRPSDGAPPSSFVPQIIQS